MKPAFIEATVAEWLSSWCSCYLCYPHLCSALVCLHNTAHASRYLPLSHLWHIVVQSIALLYVIGPSRCPDQWCLSIEGRVKVTVHKCL